MTLGKYPSYNLLYQNTWRKTCKETHIHSTCRSLASKFRNSSLQNTSQQILPFVFIFCYTEVRLKTVGTFKTCSWKYRRCSEKRTRWRLSSKSLKNACEEVYFHNSFFRTPSMAAPVKFRGDSSRELSWS